MTETEDSRESKDLELDGEVIGFFRQLSDCVCLVVKVEVWDIPFYFAEHLREDNMMRLGVRGFDITDAGGD